MAPAHSDELRGLYDGSGRIARRWRDNTGTEPPIRMDGTGYRPEEGGMRTVYQLPPGIADAIEILASS